MQSQQLLPKCEVLQEEFFSGAKDGEDPAEQMSKAHKHQGITAKSAPGRCSSKSLILRLCRVLARHRRKEEVIGLRVKQVNMLNRCVRIAPDTTKDGAGRLAYMPESLYLALEPLLRGKKPNDYVFTRPNGERVMDFDKRGGRSALLLTRTGTGCSAGPARHQLPTPASALTRAAAAPTSVTADGCITTCGAPPSRTWSTVEFRRRWQ